MGWTVQTARQRPLRLPGGRPDGFGPIPGPDAPHELPPLESLTLHRPRNPKTVTEHRPRRNDHLVEPLFGGLADAHERSVRESRPGGRGHLLWLLVSVVLAGGMFFYLI